MMKQELAGKKWLIRIMRSIAFGLTIGITGAVSFAAVVYYNPFKLEESIQQYKRHKNIYQLINPQFKGVKEVNIEINKLLNNNYHFDAIRDKLPITQQITMQATAVDMWVSNNIKYESDLQHTRFPNHYPTPEEVVQAGKDDCDGIAILTTSILLSRGIPARLALNGNHAWSELVTQPSIKTNETTPALSISVPADNVITQTAEMSVYPGYITPEGRKLWNPVVEKLLNFVTALPAERVALWAFGYTFCFICILKNEKFQNMIFKASIISIIATSLVIVVQYMPL